MASRSIRTRTGRRTMPPGGQRLSSFLAAAGRLGGLIGGLGLTGALALSIVFLPGLPRGVAEDIRFFRIGTGASSASYFPIGGVIANAISNPPGSRDCERGGSCGVPGLIAVAQTTQGSIENVEAIGAGTFESALAQADIAYWAYTGTGLFAESGAIPTLRAIANLYTESLHVVVRADSPIQSIGELKGKRVSLGEKGSGTLVTARLVLEAFGLSEKRVEPAYLELGAAADRLNEGEIDAIFMVGGHPLPAIADLAERTDIRLLPIDGEAAAALRQKHPFLTVDIIPAGSYRGTEATVSLGIGALFVVSSALEEELVYGITRALWHPVTRKLLDEGHPVGRHIRPETALSGVPIPLHPGAARYYNEVGIGPQPKVGDRS